jgi:hypothetical protein
MNGGATTIARPREPAQTLSHRARHLLLLGLVLVFHVIHEYPQLVPQDHALSVPVALVPVPLVAWHTAGWLVFGSLIFLLMRTGSRPAPSLDPLLARRAAILAVAFAYAVEVGGRLYLGGFLGLERRVGIPMLLALSLVGFTAPGGILGGPPRATVLAALLVAGGLGVRILWAAAIAQSLQHSDNPFVIRFGLDRLFYVPREAWKHLSEDARDFHDTPDLARPPGLAEGRTARDLSLLRGPCLDSPANPAWAGRTGHREAPGPRAVRSLPRAHLVQVVILLAILAEAAKAARLDQVPIPPPAARAPITVGRRV